MRTIGVVTVARSDYGIYLPLLRKIQADADLRLHLIVSGMHLSPEFGLTVKMIEADGFEIGERVEMLLSSDRPEGIAKSMGLGVIGFAQAYARFCPDILVVLGDRFEMHAAALAALPFNLPVAHLHGGELTQGAIDDALRHSMTKLSHLHFVSTQDYGRRVRQLGEEAWRVVVSGALSLDNLRHVHLLNREELAKKIGARLANEFLLVTYHPVTLEYEQAEWQVGELLAGLDQFGLPVLFTMPNADTGGRLIKHMTENYVATHPTSHIVDNLGTQAYFSAMALATAMVGNSSSGIVEAAMFKLPVVNIGTRQKGRIRSANIVDVDHGRDAIVKGIQQAVGGEFRDTLEQLTNPYGDGHAADHIVRVLKQVELNDRLVIKAFSDTSLSESGG
ncbi:MAG: UDP-N-acetylglucosamine 2-epimerase (hydrolyzing) [Thermoflexales bacterium]|nr:UDP-N-acetylglucosamine 2-epimerase (hydrolyzing) [Thermoflexales bacterium]